MQMIDVWSVQKEPIELFEKGLHLKKSVEENVFAEREVLDHVFFFSIEKETLKCPN